MFDAHAVVTSPDGTATMYIDRHLVHEVTSPQVSTPLLPLLYSPLALTGGSRETQAFEGLRNAGRKVRRNDCTLATVDHNVPTSSRRNYTDSGSFIKECVPLSARPFFFFPREAGRGGNGC